MGKYNFLRNLIISITLLTLVNVFLMMTYDSLKKEIIKSPLQPTEEQIKLFEELKERENGTDNNCNTNNLSVKVCYKPSDIKKPYYPVNSKDYDYDDSTDDFMTMYIATGGFGTFYG